ncbi:hypothetical protein AVEN_145655-1 [Araneus ventricosus]|uniref:Uncharacterized protein n=1 Tax=Araneus ventricosus TaxID=182803 RepID=A0A4Y2QPN1_ARAVE|nr:hypothetical protein AVEN_145655-1 [Araneus ventricosus]
MIFIENCWRSTKRVLCLRNKRTCGVWCNAFAISRSTVTDDDRSGRAATSIIDTNVAVVDAMIREDRRVRFHDFAYALDISCGSVSSIVHDQLGVSMHWKMHIWLHLPGN